MVNIGKPSTGCFTCRRMKVKCDEQKPACQRCIRGNRKCPGFGDVFLLVDPTRKKGPRLKKSRSIETASRDSNLLSDTGGQLETANTPLVSPFTRLRATQEDWYRRSFNLFLYTQLHRSFESNGRKREFFNPIKIHCSQADNLQPYLVEALKAASLSNMAYRVPDLKWIATKAVHHRVRALAGVRKALTRSSSAQHDDLLLALWCIEKAELTDHGSVVIHHNHAAGISAILKLRGPDQTRTELGQHLFILLNFKLAVIDVLNGTDYYYKAPDVKSIPIALLGNVAALYRQYRAKITGELPSLPKATIYGTAMAMDARVESIRPMLMQPYKAEFRTINTTRFHVKYFLVMMDVIPHVIYYMLRLRLTEIALGCSEEQFVVTGSRISDLALDLAGLLPALLSLALPNTPNPLVAEGSSQSAYIALEACNAIKHMAEFVNDDVRAWVSYHQTYIGYGFGIKQALFLEKQDHFPSVIT